MANTSIQKAMLSPAQEDKNSDAKNVFRMAVCMHEKVFTNAVSVSQEMHLGRIKALRKELDYLKETEWKYQPVDKYIGQSSEKMYH